MRIRLSLGLISAALVLLGAQVVAGAQTPSAKPHNGATKGMGFRYAKLLQSLDLTADQKQKIDPIVNEIKEKANALRKDTTLTPQARRTKMGELMKDAHSRIMPLLTPAQRDKVKAEMTKRGRGVRKGAPGAPVAPVTPGTSLKPAPPGA